MASKRQIRVGDKVAYSVQWLRGVGLSPTDPLCHARGQVISIVELSARLHLAVVDWGSGSADVPNKVNVNNLALVGPNTRFCQC